MTKSTSILNLYIAFIERRAITKDEIYEIMDYKSERSLQRYIKDLNNFFEETHNLNINYHAANQKYVLEGELSLSFTKQQALVLLKILIASRALSTEEVSSVINNMTSLLTYDDRQFIDKILASEKKSYHPINLNEPMINRIWQLHEAIHNKKHIKFNYFNAMNQERTHTIQPYFITFSELYFYIIGINEKGHTLIFRIDRIETFEVINETFHHSPPHYLSPMKIKDRIYFMYGGNLQRVRFEFNGGIIESVLDRFPTAKTVKNDHKNNKYVVEVEVIGDGILMWLLSQGRRVKVLSPQSMVDKMREEVKAIQGNYE